MCVASLAHNPCFTHRLGFLDALTSLVLLVIHSVTDTEIRNLQSYTTSVLIIEIETQANHSKLNVTQNGISLKIKCQSKWNDTQNLISLKMQCHSKKMSRRMEYHSKWNVTIMECHLNGMLLKMESH